MSATKWVIFQKPNLPLVVAVIAGVLSHILPYGKLNFAAALIYFGALFTWAWLEIFDGANNFRRALGMVVMIFIIVNRL
jgi:hypothetical protein